MKTCSNVLVLLGAVCLDVNLQKAFCTMLFLLGVFFLLLVVSLATSTFVIAPCRRWSPLPFAPIRSNIVSDKMLAEHADPSVLEGLPQDLQKQSDPRSDGQLRSTAADIADTFQHLVSHVDTSPNETTGTDARVEAATKTESQTPRPSNIRGACLLWARLTSTRSARALMLTAFVAAIQNGLVLLSGCIFALLWNLSGAQEEHDQVSPICGGSVAPTAPDGTAVCDGPIYGACA
jgi:hypothetical protein